ncbi:1-acyl-sn-glycerol-3-phosphate acyltransferase 2-like isoform X2 [Nymphaea colorata]|uniref:1-acyl-sn-glycerol-3-phosphate acyltransferase 2-like isoform X2 n=1 Tax=Nymphaea colorata TaxID=210225 RepID=UPI00214E6020|nr:1-acyl-sn-glycerol-3-phosphate acyltransferase 2-like isoform X2 [Nymphaea colorata]
MALLAAVAIVPIGLLFLLSGLVINLLQAICYLSFRPFSKRLHRRINRVLAELLWLEVVWLFDWWGGFKVQVYTDYVTLQAMGKEHALVMSNHRSDVDWLVGWVLAQRSGCLGSALAVMKKSSKFLPVFGWSMFFSEYVFLERSWAKDQATLKAGLQMLEDFPQPFWLALFVEGTRFTQEKLLAAQQYAMTAGLPVPRNTLVPRTKGFVSTINTIRSFVPAIYDVTVAVPRGQPAPTMLNILARKPSVDLLLDAHAAENTFGEKNLQMIGRPKKSLLVVLMWACILVIGAFFFFTWTALLSTWKGISCIVAILLLITLVMHVFILFTQSDRSNPATVQPVKPQNEAHRPLLC